MSKLKERIREISNELLREEVNTKETKEVFIEELGVKLTKVFNENSYPLSMIDDDDIENIKQLLKVKTIDYNYVERIL